MWRSRFGVDDDVSDFGLALADRVLEPAGEFVGLGERCCRTYRNRHKHDRSHRRRQHPHVARAYVKVLVDEGLDHLDRPPVLSTNRRIGSNRLFEWLEVRTDVSHTRQHGDRRFDPFGDLVRILQSAVGGETSDAGTRSRDRRNRRW